MSITKLQVAEKEIVAAVNVLFGGGDAVPAYVLAAAAREITTTLCKKRGLRSFIDEAHGELPKLSRRDIYREASRHASFFKHADRDPESVLVNFTDTEVDMVLFVAIYDFGELCGGMPTEAQVFEGPYVAHAHRCRAYRTQ